MKIDKKLIEELKNYLDEFGLTEIEYQDGNKKIIYLLSLKKIKAIFLRQLNLLEWRDQPFTENSNPWELKGLTNHEYYNMWCRNGRLFNKQTITGTRSFSNRY